MASGAEPSRGDAMRCDVMGLGCDVHRSGHVWSRSGWMKDDILVVIVILNLLHRTAPVFHKLFRRICRVSGESFFFFRWVG